MGTTEDLGVFAGVDVCAQAKVLAVRRLLSALLGEIQHVLRGRNLQEWKKSRTDERWIFNMKMIVCLLVFFLKIVFGPSVRVLPAAVCAAEVPGQWACLPGR